LNGTTLDCSILICTRNRAVALEKTLRAFASVRVPDGWRVEMIVADNGSTDHTSVVVANASHPAIAIRYLAVPVPGKSRAQNAAVSLAMGEVLLFTDDDIEPSDNWLEAMARPLLENRCDAVAGRILLADELRRPWMTPMHARWLAETREPAAAMPELVGASMGIRRAVFERIALFDEELGPGVTGFGEETLLWMQMKEAGMRILPVADTHVVHHPDPSRLRRESWLSAATGQGRTHAYILHHWKHGSASNSGMNASWMKLKLVVRRLLGTFGGTPAEGCPEWELCYVTRIAFLENFIRESREPRKYHLRALAKNIP
jgi:glycosyltransferase involved in cell wall biosynthesis